MKKGGRNHSKHKQNNEKHDDNDDPDDHEDDGLKIKNHNARPPKTGKGHPREMTWHRGRVGFTSKS